MTGRQLRLLIISPSQLVPNGIQQLYVALLGVFRQGRDERLQSAKGLDESRASLTYDMAPVARPASDVSAL